MKKTDESPFCKCLLFSANALSRAITRMADDEFAECGLTSSYAFLIMTVNSQPGIQPMEISKKMMLTPSTITRLVEKMERKGLLKRKTDGRFTTVFPTDKGLKLDARLKACWKNVYLRYTKLLGEKSAKQLTSEIYSAAITLEKSN
jgi:DNA-binding MarR family transcriptional regulator